MGRGSNAKGTGIGPVEIFAGTLLRGRHAQAIDPEEQAPARPAPITSLSSEQDILQAVDRGLIPNQLAPSGRAAQRSQITFIARSAELSAQSRGGGKHYRGYIGVRPAEGGGLELIGAVTYGPWHNPESHFKIYCSGEDLETTIAKVNKRLEEKQGPGGSSVYTAVPGTGPALLDRSEVFRQATRMLRR